MQRRLVYVSSRQTTRQLVYKCSCWRNEVNRTCMPNTVLCTKRSVRTCCCEYICRTTVFSPQELDADKCRRIPKTVVWNILSSPPWKPIRRHTKSNCAKSNVAVVTVDRAVERGPRRRCKRNVFGHSALVKLRSYYTSENGTLEKPVSGCVLAIKNTRSIRHNIEFKTRE